MSMALEHAIISLIKQVTILADELAKKAAYERRYGGGSTRS
jgi:hypothetical protein